MLPVCSHTIQYIASWGNVETPKPSPKTSFCEENAYFSLGGEGDIVGEITKSLGRYRTSLYFLVAISTRNSFLSTYVYSITKKFYSLILIISRMTFQFECLEQIRICSETTLTGESRFHISTPLGIEPSWREANGWTTGPVGLCMNAVRFQALYRASSQQPTMLVVKPEGGPAAKRSPRGHQCCETMLKGESRFHIGTPLGIEPSWREANRWTTRPVGLCMNVVRLQALHKLVF